MIEQSQAASSTRARAVILLVLILLLATAVRVWNIGQRSMWLDEFLTVGGSNSQIYTQFDLPTAEVVEHPPDYISLSAAPPWYYIWTRASGEVHPPLFYLTLRFWRDLVPDADSWARGLSVLFALTSIVFLYICVCTQAGETPALWASLLMAVAGVQIDYSQEVRSYTMLLTALLAACAGVLLIERYGFTKGRAALLGIGSLVAVLTHYLALPILAILGIYALIRLDGQQRKRTLLTFIIAGIAFGCLWGPFAFAQRHGFMGKLWHTKDMAWSVPIWLMHIVDLPSRFFINVSPEHRKYLAVGVLFYVVPLFFVRRNPALLLWMMILLLGTGVDATSDLFRRAKMLDTPRYTMPVSPAVYAIAALLAYQLKDWRRHLLPAVICVICLLSLPHAYDRFKADWRGFGAFIATNFSPQDVLVMNEPKDDTDPLAPDWRIRADYLSMNYYARIAYPAMVFLKEAPSEQIRQRIGAGHTIWFFTSHDAQKTESILPRARFTPALSVDRVGRLEKVELEPGN